MGIKDVETARNDHLNKLWSDFCKPDARRIGGRLMMEWLGRWREMHSARAPHFAGRGYKTEGKGAHTSVEKTSKPRGVFSHPHTT